MHRFSPFALSALGLLCALTALLTIDTGQPAVGFAVFAVGGVLASAAAEFARVRLTTNRQRNEAVQCTDGTSGRRHHSGRRQPEMTSRRSRSFEGPSTPREVGTQAGLRDHRKPVCPSTGG
ncbi:MULTISPECIES: hypothetical protein [Rhodococcus]|uniref:hypothetical protein n=1 Tax=Rhodococcus TaxID=1827 RepID=UPI00295445B5|nr:MULTISPECIES: hypothetical protein [Rhodococcus]MDV7276205.1 hypothetical protein [Rhodococcus oxybenzonivorans]MDV8102443.1 hypothetical protein [Rhodococcus sp. IEGM 69]